MLAHLRDATKSAHASLEGALGLLDDHLDLDAYRLLLERFYGFWHGWQPQVAALLQDEAFLEPRRRLHLLAADLATLGVSPHAVGMLPLRPMPPLRDAAEALGSLYVMEGSTLGGRTIERHVERCLGLSSRSGCTYFAGYGATTGVMWQSFLARLDEQPMRDAGRLAAGAGATFESVGWWLTRDERLATGTQLDPGRSSRTHAAAP